MGSDIATFVAALDGMDCVRRSQAGTSPQNLLTEGADFWPPEAETALRHVAATCIGVGQTHFYFDATGRFLGHVTDDTWRWLPRGPK